MTDSAFSSFTNLYALPKTLRFELVPIGETRNTMNANLKYDENLQTFLLDQQIEDAYQVLKPVFDNIHEEFITKSLENDEAKKIDFSKYEELKKALGKIDKKQKEAEYKTKQKEITAEEKKLRGNIVKLYEKAGDELVNEAGNNEKGKQILTEKGFKVLTENGILKYIKANIDKFVELKLKTRKEIVGKKENKNLVEKEDLIKALVKTDTENKGVFEGFFTYFSGFNQNRENYYSEEEKSTGIANRIINENLPKFVDNMLLFEKQSEEYVNAFKYLQRKNITLKNKEGADLYVIKKTLFEIDTFKTCLSQSQIEDYNTKIGNANFLINLYNQQKKKDTEAKNEKLPQFKILYKQIGCGEKKEFIKLITSPEELKEKLLEIEKAGQKYFVGISNADEEKDKIDDFVNLLENRKDYKGIYWNKQAINTISGKYFANWHGLQDKLKDAKVFQKADRSSGEEYKIPEAIELSDLFAVLDKNASENWQDKEKGTFFKASVFTDRNVEIINKIATPSQALLHLMLADLQESAKNFINNKKVIEDGRVKIVDFNADNEKVKIKLWLDETLAVNRMLKYFLTKENKRKGSPQDSEIENLLKKLVIDVDWFKNYDAVRNYLTKKPQSEINKLKLNFENGSLLGGWSDGQEKLKGAVLLKNNDKFYVGILGKKKNIFDTENEDNHIYKASDKHVGRLMLANLKFQTLAGKGFLGEFGKSYGNMGKENPKEAIKSLKKIIQERYVKKYPLLQKILDTNYTDKKEFDKDIQEILKDSYVCEFKPIDWNVVENYINTGDLYVFEIKCNHQKAQYGYWKKTFEENSTIQLSGGAEVFYRQVAIKDKNEKKVKDKAGNEITKEYIIEKKRFTEEKFLFHCPLKLNYKEKSYSKPQYAINEINTKINTVLTKPEHTGNICFLGTDRGEKNLAYYSLVNQKGEILEQGSFNLPFLDENGNPRSIKVKRKSFERDDKNQIVVDEKGQEKVKTEMVECWNYNDLLEARAFDRDFARKNWQTIGTIKELKDGYISQVVRKIVDLAVKHNAFIVLENLNSGFKNSRKKIEKQVYQKLELALAKKLNFVVDKNAKDGELESIQKALQLTPPVNNFGDIENAKQYGIMLYTSANYTSQTDPKTGWRKTIYLQKGSEENIKTQICKAFDEFGFDGKEYYFTYTTKYKHKEKIVGGKKWTLYAGKDGKSLDRYRSKPNPNDTSKWQIEKLDVVAMLDGIFEKYGKTQAFKFTIDSKNGTITNEQNQEFEPTKKGDFTAWESLRFAIDILQQIRNSGPKNADGTPTRNDDFLHSPVRDGDGKNGKHFDSREFLDKENKGKKAELPSCGDANGAYNIARKGIMMFERIKTFPERPDLLIFDKDWDVYLGNDEYTLGDLLY